MKPRRVQRRILCIRASQNPVAFRSLLAKSSEGDADAVSAPACAHQDMLRSLEDYFLSQDRPEDLKFGVAQLRPGLTSMA